MVGETFQLPASTPEVQNLLECNGQPISDHIFPLLAPYIAIPIAQQHGSGRI